MTVVVQRVSGMELLQFVKVRTKTQACDAITFTCMCTAICSSISSTNGMISYSPDTTPKLEGTVATHSCDDGYILSGGINRTCQSDRTWSGGSITCEGTDAHYEFTAQTHAILCYLQILLLYVFSRKSSH